MTHAISPPAPAEWVPCTDLLAWDRNPKPHDESNVKEIARSIRRFDFGAPIVAWRSKRQVVAGHGRLLGASLLMREDPGRLLATDAPGPGLVPVRWMEFASESEAAAYALADNRLTEVNPMTDAAVADILREIEAEGGDVNIPGYSEDDLKALLAPDVADVPDPGAEEPDPQGEPDSKPGEVYELGPHRLVCGDSLSKEYPEAWHDADIVIADPPYGTKINSKTGLGNSNISMNLIGDGSTDTAKNAFSVWRSVGNIQVWWGANYYSDGVDGSPCWLVWDKDHHGMTFADAELAAVVGTRSPVRVFRHAWSGMHRDSERSIQREHPTQKPVALYVWALDTILATAKLVVDPFGGSGTTLIACAQTGRVARLIEIDPRYCDVIRRRWTKWAREAGVDPGPGKLE